jgi:hypothetical protein
VVTKDDGMTYVIGRETNRNMLISHKSVKILPDDVVVYALCLKANRDNIHYSIPTNRTIIVK